MNRFAIGVDIGGTATKFGIIADDGKIIRRLARDTGRDMGGFLGVLNDGICTLFDFAEDRGYNISHIGIASPGAVNIETGIILGSCPNIPFLTDVNLKAIVSCRDIKIFADNDANAACWAETVVGVGKGFENILYITIGTGVGGGIVINGKLYHGSNYGAAEIGHIIIHPGGRKCGCGNYGCMERYASVPGMIMSAKHILARRRSGKLWKIIDGDFSKLTPKLITREFNNGDIVAMEIIDKQAEALAQGVAGAINLLNPQLLIIGGAISESGRKYIKRLSKAITEKTFPASNVKLKIRRAKLGGKAGIVGAAMLGWTVAN